MTAEVAGLDGWLAETRGWVDAELQRRLPEGGFGVPQLAAAMRHAVFGGGKRLRPALVRAVGETLGAGDAELAAPAAAIELLHTYSLVHDDLPCMDDDDLRRGRPTCHKIFGEALAVLAGDALQALAFETVLDAPRPAESARVLAIAAGPAGMVGGQVLDLSLECAAADREAVEAVHRAKTAALFEAACELGALAAAGEQAARRAARELGRAIGLAFQAVDDVLDVVGDPATLGKTPGKDAALERGTLVAALGLGGARRVAEERTAEARSALARLAPSGAPRIEALLARLLDRRA